MTRLSIILCLFCLISTTNLIAQFFDLEEGIVGYYPFNGNAEDKTGGGNDGFVSGATLTTDRYGNPNSAYKFDGRKQSIRIPYNEILDFTSKKEYSISIWIRPRDVNSGCIIMKNYDFGLKWGGLKQSSTIYSGIASSFMQTNFKNWSTNGWYNVVIVQEVSRILYYINGKLDYSENRPHDTANKAEDIFIGRHPYFWGAFEGDIDDICIFERALSKLEVESLFQIEQMPVEVVPKKNLARIDPNSIDGTWQGIFSQPGNSNFNSYAYWLSLKVEGEKVSGYSRVEIANSEAYGIMTITGSLSQTKLNVKERVILREKNPSSLDWCVKFTNLRYNPQDNSLRGRWLSDNCKENGEIILFSSDIPFNFYENKEGTFASMDEITAILASNVSKPKEDKESLVNKKIEIAPINFVFGSSRLSSESQT